MRKGIFWALGGVLSLVLIGVATFIVYTNFNYGPRPSENGVISKKENEFKQKEFRRLIQFLKGGLKNQGEGWKKTELMIQNAYKQIDEPEEEIEFLKARLKEQPDQFLDMIRFHRVGEIYHKRLKNFNQAKQYYILALTKYEDPSSLMGLSEISEVEGDVHQAIQFRERALKKMTLVDTPVLARNRAKRLMELSSLYLKVNRKEDAERVFREALQLDPQNLSAKETLQKLSAESGTSPKTL